MNILDYINKYLIPLLEMFHTDFRFRNLVGMSNMLLTLSKGSCFLNLVEMVMLTYS